MNTIKNEEIYHMTLAVVCIKNMFFHKERGKSMILMPGNGICLGGLNALEIYLVKSTVKQIIILIIERKNYIIGFFS